MKKIYLLLTVFVISLSMTACTSSSDDDTSSQPDTVTKSDDNKSGENNVSDSDNNLTVDNNQTVEPIITTCSDEDNIPNGECSMDGEINCNVGFKLTTNGLSSECIQIECLESQVLVGNICEDKPSCSKIDEILNEETSKCEKDESVLAVTNGTVRDGLISGATISTCKIVDNNKSEANTTCSKTDSKGEFECAIYESDYEYLIFKATGGTDLGENSDSRDDRENIDVLRTVSSKADIEKNTSSFITPATNLIVLNASKNGWNVETAITTVTTSLGTSKDDIFDSQKGIESATVVANILDAVGSDKNRTEISFVLSSETSIYSESTGITAGVLTKIDDRISADVETILNTQITKSIKNPSDINEKVIDELSNRVEHNQPITEVIANNFNKVLETEYVTDTKVLDLVSEIPTEKDISELKVVTDKISEILDGVTDSTKATEVLKDKLSKDSDISKLTVDEIKAEIGEITCGDGQRLNGTICENIPEVVITPKDEVSSPDDIPAIPNNGARNFKEASFPTMPQDKGYLVVSEDNLTKLSSPSDNKYPTTQMKSGDDNQTTPNSNY